MAKPYEKQTKDELLELAAAREVEGRSSMSKAELIAALRGEKVENADADQAPSEPDDGQADDGPGFAHEDTPSGLALKKVGPDGDGEAYQAEKRKHRWG